MNAAKHKPTTLLVCPHCMADNDESAYFCRVCFTPISSHAVIDPMYRIYSEWNTYRKAIASPTKLITVIGMWLIFGPTTLSMAGVMIFGAIEAYHDPHEAFASYGIPFILAAAFFGVQLWLYGTMLFRVTRSYRRRPTDFDDEEASGESSDVSS